MDKVRKNFNAETFFAHLVSIISSPWLLMPLFLFVFLFRKFPLQPLEISIFIILQISVIVPFYFSHIISEYPNLLAFKSIPRKKRDSMYLGLLAGALLNVGLFTQDPNYKFFVTLGMVMSVFWGLYYITNKVLDKTSVHAGVATFVTMFAGGTYPLLFALLIFLPLVCWSRIKLHKHTWAQLIIGITIGGFVGILGWGM